jgi:H+/Cl- antiporter ClcA
VTEPIEAFAVMRSRRYVALLVFAAVIGVVVSAAAYGFLALISKVEHWVYVSIPSGLGFSTTPDWWPLPVLVFAGVVVALTITYLPGTAGESPLRGFHPGGTPTAPAALPGALLAALASISLGAVIGPEMPLIALGAGLGVIAVKLAKRDAPPQMVTVLAAAGSFAAISALLGSPLLGAFLLLEAAGLTGGMLDLVLVPGLLAAGVGSLVFIGLNSWTGLGTYSLALPGLPHVGHPTIAEFGWALVIGVVAAVLGTSIRRLAVLIAPHVQRRLMVLTPTVGLAIGGLAVIYTEATGKPVSDVLFSGENDMSPLIAHSASYSIGALVLLIAFKSIAYGGSLASFRGGPTFPGMFLGAAGGIAMSHLPGLPMVPSIAMGIGAMSVVMLKLPLTSVLLATLLLSSDGLSVMPVVIVAVVVSFVVSLRLAPPSAPATDPSPSAASTTAGNGPAPSPQPA